MMLADAIGEFKRTHDGAAPTEVLVTPSAAVVLTAQESLPSIWDGVPVRVAPLPFVVGRGKGTRLVLAAPMDKLGRPCVLALETDGSPGST